MIDENHPVTLGARLATGVLLIAYAALLILILLLSTPAEGAGPADEVTGVRGRVSITTEALHGQGYWSPSLRYGVDGGWGLRFGSMRAPVWANRIPDSVSATHPVTKQKVSVPLELGEDWKIESITMFEVDREFCGVRWCGALGIAKMSDTTYMNGTKWNFGLHVRYAIDKNWSLVLDHYSHGRMLGIAEDKSNRGWNLIGVAYTFGDWK